MVVSQATPSQPALSEVKGAVNAAICCNPERTYGGHCEAPIAVRGGVFSPRGICFFDFFRTLKGSYRKRPNTARSCSRRQENFTEWKKA